MHPKLKDYEVHPAANLFPLMDDAELASLASDIKENGLRKPVTLFDGKVLDGRNRIAACDIAGVDPYFETLFSCPSPTSYVLSINLHRRHLKPSQKAAIATEALPMFEAEAAARKKKLSGTRANPGEKQVKEIIPEPQARDKAAAACEVNPRYVSDAKAIKEKSPEKFQQVLSGEKTIPAAKKEIATEKERESIKARKPRGSYADWQKFRAACVRAGEAVDELKDLVVDADHVIPAREAATKICKQLERIISKL